MSINILDKLTHARYVVVLSASYKDQSDAFNEAQTEHLHADIKKLCPVHTHAHGYYDGHCEQSFIVYCDDMFDVLKLLPLRAKYNQDCLLIVDNKASTAMLYWADDVTMIGHEWVEISLADTYDISAYTRIDDRYFAIN
jgi:hypothetical protein